MLNDTQLNRYADVLLWGLRTARSAGYRKGDVILVRFHLPAIHLAEILQSRILKAGMHPVLRLSPTPTMEKDFYSLAKRDQLTFQSPGTAPLYKRLNGGIFLHAPESITHLSSVDPKKIGLRAVSLKPLRDIMDRRDAQGLFGWTLCMLPTHEQSKHANLSMAEYTDQIVKACWLNRRDPVSQWKIIYKNAQKVKRWLNRMSVKHYHIESANIDLIISPGEQRRWIGLSGHNIPSFELFLSPDWRGTKGVYFANLPSYRSGNLVANVRLEFKEGRAIKIEADEGEDFARQQLGMDSGANRVGEFSLTDKRYSKINRFMANTLYDENFGGSQGNCHVAVGSSYADTFSGEPAELTKARKRTLGFNDSALHWDLVNTEKKRVVAHLKSGRRLTIYENGRFTYL